MKKAKILLVDDSQVVIMNEKMLLRHLGDFEVVTACNGRQGVEMAQAELPDLILLDVVMPEMNGFDACRAIRSDPATRHIPIIMVTTRGEEDNLSEGFTAGCSDYITKPIDKNVLAQKMQDLLE